MMKKLLLAESPIGLPKHIVIVLDGNGEHYNSSNQSIQKLIEIVHSFELQVITVILVSETSLSLPHEKLVRELKIIISELEQLVGKIDMKMQILGDLLLCPDIEIENELFTLVQKFHGQEIVEIGLFYSSLNEILKEKPKNYSIPDPDMFIRTSGEKRIGDLLLEEMSRSCCYLYEKPLDLANLSSYKLYFILSDWEKFRERRAKMEELDPSRFEFKNVHKELEMKHTGGNTSFREDSGTDSKNLNRAYFQTDSEELRIPDNE